MSSVGDKTIRWAIEKRIPGILGEGWIVTAIYRYDIVCERTVWAALAQCGFHVELVLFTINEYGGILMKLEATYMVMGSTFIDAKDAHIQDGEMREQML